MNAPERPQRVTWLQWWRAKRAEIAEERAADRSARGPLVRLAVDIWSGSLLFLLLLIPTVALDVLLHGLGAWHISPFIRAGLRYAKYWLFAVDVGSFAVYLLYAAWHFIHTLKWSRS